MWFGGVGPGDLDDLGGASGVDPGGGEAAAVVESRNDGLGPVEGDVGHDEALEERAPLGDGRDRRPDAACADHEDVHDAQTPVTH